MVGNLSNDKGKMIKERKKEMEGKNEGRRERMKGEMDRGGKERDIHEGEIMARTFWAMKKGKRRV
jgi:hypothetical protein